jgi:hypothetical protein
MLNSIQFNYLIIYIKWVPSYLKVEMSDPQVFLDKQFWPQPIKLIIILNYKSLI